MIRGQQEKGFLLGYLLKVNQIFCQLVAELQPGLPDQFMTGSPPVGEGINVTQIDIGVSFPGGFLLLLQEHMP